MTWPVVPFEDLYLTPSRNGVTRPARVRGSGVKMINMGELFAHERIASIEMERVQLSEPELLSMTVEPGDLLFARQSLVLSGAGKCSIVTEVKEPTTFESHLIRVRLKREVAEPLFFHYYFRAPNSGMKAIVTQGVQAGIRGSDLKRLPVRLPPLGTQERIVGTLSAYDDLIDNNRKRIALLEEAARLLYREWFVEMRFPGHEHVTVVNGVPERWYFGTLGEIAYTNRSSYTSKDLPDEINYIDIASVETGRVVSQSVMLSNAAPGRARRRAADGDIIWSNVRPNLRAYALILDPKENDVYSTGFTVLSATTVPFTWLYLFVTTDWFVGHLVNHATGAGYPAVRPADFERAVVLVPPTTLLQLFHEATEPSFRLISKLEQQSRKLAEARDLLLPRLMNGELAV